MKLVRFWQQGQKHPGILHDDMVEAAGETPLAGQRFPLAEVRLAAPVDPPNVIAIGLNYGRHAAESKMKALDHPLMFLKATTSVIGPEQAIVLPQAAPDEVDYEAELCLVIGKQAKHVGEKEALDYVLGYTCGNDVSARDCQIRHDTQWARAKSFDTFCPLGPWIETEISDPDNLPIRSRLNGQVMQDSSTADLIFNCRALISFLSHNLTLMPGTVIMTGTPEGVGFVRQPPIYLKPGDVIEVEIEGIGALRNSVQAEPS